jgi:hypothetical protein
MTRPWLIVSIGALSFAAAACGGYDEKNAAYDEKNASYESNAAYDETGNATYDGAGNAAYDASGGNAAYAPPADANASTNIGEPPPADPTTNGY